jgi:hypothetical protein
MASRSINVPGLVLPHGAGPIWDLDSHGFGHERTLAHTRLHPKPGFIPDLSHARNHGQNCPVSGARHSFSFCCYLQAPKMLSKYLIYRSPRLGEGGRGGALGVIDSWSIRSNITWNVFGYLGIKTKSVNSSCESALAVPFIWKTMMN